jgi:Glycosyl transferase family 2
MLTRLDSQPIPEAKAELRLFCVVRNEALRLPYFLKYYSARGVERFFFVDNNSADTTTQVLLGEPNVHVFSTEESFSGALYGLEWIKPLISEYGMGQWSVVADADELLVYPGWEKISIPQLCTYLSREGANALRCILVDMYSDRPFAETEYFANTDPLDICPYFESDSILRVRSLADVGERNCFHIGGMRRRLFGLNVRLDKVSLIRYAPTMSLESSMHDIGSAILSSLRGAMLHFKYFSDFHERAVIETARGEHWNEGEEYARYASTLATRKSLKAYTGRSQRFSGSKSLIHSHVIEQNDDFVRFFNDVLGHNRLEESMPHPTNR